MELALKGLLSQKVYVPILLLCRIAGIEVSRFAGMKSLPRADTTAAPELTAPSAKPVPCGFFSKHNKFYRDCAGFCDVLMTVVSLLARSALGAGCVAQPRRIVRVDPVA